nr:MAG TPA: hypothetical protein [Caudoviricetes sp.]
MIIYYNYCSTFLQKSQVILRSYFIHKLFTI